MRSLPMRVLHVVGDMDCGGVATMIMSYYRQIDRRKVQFDFVVWKPGEQDFSSEIRELGGRVFHVAAPAPVQVPRHVCDLVRTMRREGPFVAVHAHNMHHGAVALMAAAVAGIGVRVCHSHNSYENLRISFWRKARHTLMKMAIRTCSSSHAGRYLYGNHWAESGKATVLPNAFDIDPYVSFDRDKRMALRKELGVPERALVLGHVGRFASQKNHAFLVSVMKTLMSLDSDVYLVLVGDGPLRRQIENEVVSSGLEGRVRFLGMRSEIPQLLNVFDVFVFPSLYEGLGIAVIEAQAAGVPCVVSSAVPSEVDLGLGLVKFLNLSGSLHEWCAAILEQSRRTRPAAEVVAATLRERGYDIRSSVDRLLKLYGVA